MNPLPSMIQLSWPLAVLATVTQILAMVLGVLFFVPLLFQGATGLKALKGKIRLKFWIVCLISLTGQVLSTHSLLSLMAYHMKKHEIRDGLGFVFLEFAGALMMVLLLLVIAAQLMIHYRRNKSNALQ